MKNRMMKRFGFLAGAIVILLFTGLVTSCRSSEALSSTPQEKVQKTYVVEDESSLPSFPVAMLYVIAREWEEIHDEHSDKYATEQAQEYREEVPRLEEYMERRLLQLCPEEAYVGCVEQIMHFAHHTAQSLGDKVIKLPKMQELRLLEENVNVQGKRQVVDTLGSGMDGWALLELGDDEQRLLHSMDSLASAKEFCTAQDFDSVQLNAFERENVLLAVLLWNGPRAFYRIILSKTRAEQMARHYYGAQTNNGKRGDAFKHIYVNTLLRSYVGRVMSYFVMDVLWEKVHKNAPCDYYMDIHNNRIGRVLQYHRFTDSKNDTIPSWQQWAVNVHDYIERKENAQFKEWNKETPTFIIEQNMKQVVKQKYVYWSE